MLKCSECYSFFREKIVQKQHSTRFKRYADAIGREFLNSLIGYLMQIMFRLVTPARIHVNQ